MSRVSPATGLFNSDDRPDAARTRNMQPHEILDWSGGAPALHFQDGIVETVTTQVIRKRTIIRPITLPQIPPPPHLDMPHLPRNHYPLAAAPPRTSGPINVSLGGHRLSFQPHGARSQGTLSPGQTWARTSRVGPNTPSVEADIARYQQPSALGALTPPRTDGKSRSRADSPSRSPPRKRNRASDAHSTHRRGPLPSPLPSPEPASPPLEYSGAKMGTGIDMAALLSMPALLHHFDQLHDKAKMHVFEHMLRRSKREVLQQVAEFAGSALRRDFLGDLPHEVAVQVLKSLDSRSLAKAARVNKTWCRLIDNERSIWLRQLVEEGLYLGHGVEEAEERWISRRMRLVEKLSLANSTVNWPVPLKHVFRRRFTSANGWINKRAKQWSFPATGSSGSIITGSHLTQGKIVTARDRKLMHVYDAASGSLIGELEGHTEGIWATDAYANVVATGSTDRSLRIWNLDTGRHHIFQGHESTIRCLKIVQPVWYEEEQQYIPPCPVIVSGSRDGKIRIWRLPEEHEDYFNDYNAQGIAIGVPPERNPYHLRKVVGHTEAVRAIACHGRLILSASYDTSVRVWDVMDGSSKKVLMGHEDKVYSIVYDKMRHRCVSGSVDNTVRVWDVGTGECLFLLTGHTALVGMLESSANRLLLAATVSSLRLWDIDDYTRSDHVDTRGSAVSAFTHDAVKIIYAADGAVRMADSRTGHHVKTLSVGITSAWQCTIQDHMLIIAARKAERKVYEIFDFGKLDHQSGLDDERLDVMEANEWREHMPLGLDDKWYAAPVDPTQKPHAPIDSYRPSRRNVSRGSSATGSHASSSSDDEQVSDDSDDDMGFAAHAAYVDAYDLDEDPLDSSGAVPADSSDASDEEMDSQGEADGAHDDVEDQKVEDEEVEDEEAEEDETEEDEDEVAEVPAAANIPPARTLQRSSSSQLLAERLQQRAEAAVQNASSSRNAVAGPSRSSLRLRAQRGAVAEPQSLGPAFGESGAGPSHFVPYTNYPGYMSYTPSRIAGSSVQHGAPRMGTRRSVGATANGSPLPRSTSAAGLGTAASAGPSGTAEPIGGASEVKDEDELVDDDWFD